MKRVTEVNIVDRNTIPDNEIQNAFLDLSACRLCPRSCGVDRIGGQVGYCGETAAVRAARAALHFYEEPVISGRSGSGAVFFTGCNLGCIFCQNTVIASSPDSAPAGSANPRRQSGSSEQNEHTTAASDPISASASYQTVHKVPVTPDRLSDIFLQLQAQGACNINLVTPSHFVPLLIPALRSARRSGLKIPVVYNTGSYERPEVIAALEGLVDIWLADLKYMSEDLSRTYSHAPDYFSYASAAIQEMVRQCPEPLFADGTSTVDAVDDADDPLMVRGVIVRHLALPGCVQDSKKVLRYLHRTYGDSIFISLMNQYTPTARVQGDPLLGRRLTRREYDRLVDYAIRIGIRNGFIQEEGTASDTFVPLFDGTGL